MAGSETRRPMPAAQDHGERPWVPIVLVVVGTLAFAAGWRAGRGWGRLTGW